MLIIISYIEPITFTIGTSPQKTKKMPISSYMYYFLKGVYKFKSLVITYLKSLRRFYYRNHSMNNFAYK